MGFWVLQDFILYQLIISLITDIADDYIHISATLNSISADDTTASKKWV